MATVSGSWGNPTVGRIYTDSKSPVNQSGGSVGVLTWISESDSAGAIAPCFKVVSPTVSGWPIRLSAWPVDGYAPPNDFTLTIADAYGSSWTVSIDKDGDDNFLSNPLPPVQYGPLTITCTDFGAISRRMRFALFFADAEPGVSYAGTTFDSLSPLTTQGDILFRNATTNTRLGIGTAGQPLRTNTGATALEYYNRKPPVAVRDTIIASNFDRRMMGAVYTTPISGTMFLTAIEVFAYQVITSIRILSGTTAAVLPTNWWFALYDSSLNLLRQTADQLTAAVAASTVYTLALSSTYTVPSDTYVYAGYMFAATSTPSVTRFGVVGNTNATGQSPITDGTSTTGLTTTAPNPAAALTAATAMSWVALV